jgi:formylglycine-generating enzyme required for sulfatase activity
MKRASVNRHVDRTRAVLGAALALAASLGAASVASGQTACDADLNGDRVVGAADLASVLSAWGACAGCAADLNRDGAVDAADLGALLSLWGAPCNPVPWATVLEEAPDPAVVTNSALRKAIAATGLPWRVRDNGTNIEMLLVPPGTFDMGCSASVAFACGVDESPVHTVTISNAFYLGRCEVRQSQWSAITGSNPSFFKGAAHPNAANRPVEMVSWNAIQGFLTATGMRLPTEAEWEYAYRAGTTTAFHSTPSAPTGSSDDAFAPGIGWFAGNNGSPGAPGWGTKVVGLKAANALGFHDMAGGVIEWMNDFHSDTYYASSPSVNPQGPSTGTGRVIRGGSWVDPSDFLRASWRDVNVPTTANFCTGFRVARNP